MRAQRAREDAILRDARGAAYATEHRIRALADAPIVDHAALAPWIDRIARGEQGVLTASPVLMMERSGGSTGGTKLVPYTRAVLDEFSQATGPWMRDLARAHPGVLDGTSYWSISPATRLGERTSGGVPLGFDDDTAYFGPLERWALRRLLAVPPEIARVRDVDAWRDETARRLHAARDLAFVSVWSPTFLSQLLDAMPSPPAWPRLALVSCWTDGPSAAFVDDLRRLRAPIQGKGLLATEGVVTIPYQGDPLLAVASHVYEFLDLARPEGPPLRPWELREGAAYSPILTTGAGLLRYHLKDVVRCVGHAGLVPRLRFEGKLDQVADLVGEKVSAAQADAALDAAWAKLGLRPAFAMLAPSTRPRPHYVLYVDAAAPHAEDAGPVVDAALAASHAYAHARALGQLGPVRVARVRDGRRAVERHLASLGARLGGVKPTSLDPHPRWDGVLE